MNVFLILIKNRLLRLPPVIKEYIHSHFTAVTNNICTYNGMYTNIPTHTCITQLICRQVIFTESQVLKGLLKVLAVKFAGSSAPLLIYNGKFSLFS